jgi:hypothetical protein
MCRQNLPASAFRPNAKLQGGLHSYCRECAAERQRRWRFENPEKIAAYNQAKRRPLVGLECVECGRKFEGRPHAKVCSKLCKGRRWERRKRERRRETAGLAG